MPITGEFLDAARLAMYGKFPDSQSKSNAMTQQQEVLSRIDARIPLSVRDAIDRAAALQGRSHTDFLIAAADAGTACGKPACMGRLAAMLP